MKQNDGFFPKAYDLSSYQLLAKFSILDTSVPPWIRQLVASIADMPLLHQWASIAKLIAPFSFSNTNVFTLSISF